MNMREEEKISILKSLEELIDGQSVNQLNQFFENISPAETARVISRLNGKHRIKFLVLFNPEEAVEILQDLPDEQVADLLEEIDPKKAADILNKMRDNEQADILADIDEEEAQEILAAMPSKEAEKARQLMQYPEDTAGGIMSTQYLAYPEKSNVDQVLKDLNIHSHLYSDYYVQYAYIISNEGLLVGVLRMRDLPLSPRTKRIRSLMIENPVTVTVDAPLDELMQLFEEHNFVGIPVVKKNGKLVGVVRRDEVLEAFGERESDNYLKASGIVGGEEFRSMPLWERSKRRLSWLSINILLNVLAASVIAMYQETLSSVIALAVFLPIISDMSGCSGNQAVAVSMRELTLGLVKPHEGFRILFKEIGVGLINGIALGFLLGLIAYLWKGNIFLGLVVGGAMALNTIIAVCLGGIVPLLLKKMKKDPALASGPVLTTVTDLCGFFLVLSFATMIIKQLQ